MLVMALLSQPLAATPYEAQIGGFMTAVLQTFITGEFAGRSPSNADAALHRPVCKPGDYDQLRAAAEDKAAFDAFRRKCKLVEGRIDDAYVYSTAYLPHGYCETLKGAMVAALDTILGSENSTNLVILNYKGSRHLSNTADLARHADLEVKCLNDGALMIRTSRKSKSSR